MGIEPMTSCLLDTRSNQSELTDLNIETGNRTRIERDTISSTNHYTISTCFKIVSNIYFSKCSHEQCAIK